MDLRVTVGINTIDTITVHATIDDGAITAATVKFFLPEDADAHANNRQMVNPFATPVEIEHLYTLPSGTAPRIEVAVTAAGAALPVTVNVTTTFVAGGPFVTSGVTGETLAVTLA